MPARERIWVGWVMVTVTVTCSPFTGDGAGVPGVAR